jgi:electron transport complex protein RnfG
MREMIKMVVVLTVLSAFSGGLLAAIRNGTQEKIDYQKLTFVQGPAIKEILDGSSNDPIVDRFTVDDNGVERRFFIGKFSGEASAVAFETSGKGYGGDVGVMVGIDTKEDKILGVRVTTHAETPGVGARAKTELDFVSQFNDQTLDESYKVKTDGGQVDALSGATMTSKAVSAALSETSTIYRRLKSQIEEKLKSAK